MSSGAVRQAMFAIALVQALAWYAAFAAAPPACEQPCKQATRACIAEECRGSIGPERRSCTASCRRRGGCVPIRTLAYVVTECESDGNGTLLSARQELRIRRGNCTPVSVASF